MLATVVNITHPDTGHVAQTAMILEVNDDGYIQDRYPDETIDGYIVDVESYARQLGVVLTGSAVYNGRTGLIADT